MDTQNGMVNSFDPEDYELSYELGFLLKDPLTELPEYFNPWNKIAKFLPELIERKGVRHAVNQLPLLDHTNLNGCKEHRFAHMALSWITSAYVMQDGDSGVTKVLPRQLSIPLCSIANYLEIQPIILHMSVVLSNWKLKDKGGTTDFSNIESIVGVYPKEACDWFCIVTWLVEKQFAPAVKIFEKIHESVSTKNTNTLVDCLMDLQKVICNMESAINRMYDKLSPDEFYNSIRPFLSGWGGSGTSLPDGLIYEGVSEQPIKLSGGSAAQSSSIQAIDAVLGIKHSSGSEAFLNNMRDYMPRKHAQYIKDLWKRPSVRAYVSSSTDLPLKAAYNAAVDALQSFRSFHIRVVTRYIVIPSKKPSINDFQSISEQGTGGTSIMPFLKNLRDKTVDCQL